jgi:hypothetical protein
MRTANNMHATIAWPVRLRPPQTQPSRPWSHVGLISYMGAKFTASEQALAPVLRDVAKRGLIYVDDGSSARSIAGQIAGANNLPYAKPMSYSTQCPLRLKSTAPWHALK